MSSVLPPVIFGHSQLVQMVVPSYSVGPAPADPSVRKNSSWLQVVALPLSVKVFGDQTDTGTPVPPPFGLVTRSKVPVAENVLATTGAATSARMIGNGAIMADTEAWPMASSLAPKEMSWIAKSSVSSRLMALRQRSFSVSKMHRRAVTW